MILNSTTTESDNLKAKAAIEAQKEKLQLQERKCKDQEEKLHLQEVKIINQEEELQNQEDRHQKLLHVATKTNKNKCSVIELCTRILKVNAMGIELYKNLWEVKVKENENLEAQVIN